MLRLNNNKYSIYDGFGGYGVGYSPAPYGGGYSPAGYGGYGGTSGFGWLFALLILILISLQFGRDNKRCVESKTLASACNTSCNNVVLGTERGNCNIDNSILFIIIIFLLLLFAGLGRGNQGYRGSGGFGGYGF